MPIDFRCSRCQNPMQRPDHMAGKKATCPKCSNLNDVPVAGAAPAPAVPAAPVKTAAPPGAVAFPPAKPIVPPAKPIAPPPKPVVPLPTPPAAAPEVVERVATDAANEEKKTAPLAKPAPPPFAQPVPPRPAPPRPKPAAAEKPAVVEKPVAEKPVVEEKPAPAVERVASDAGNELKRATPVPEEKPKPVVPLLARPAPPKPAPSPPKPAVVERPVVDEKPALEEKPTRAAERVANEAATGATKTVPPAVKPAPHAVQKAPPKMAAAVVIEGTEPAENRELAGPRWENYGMGIGSYFVTILQVWISPARTFRNLNGDVGPLPATWFMLVGLLIAGYIHGLALFFLPTEVLESFDLKELSMYFKVGAHDTIGAVLLTGLITLIGTLFLMGLYYLEATMINSILRTLGAEADSIEHTYRVLALVLGATAWLSFIPVVGPLLTLLAQPPLQMLSVGPANGVSRLRSFIAVGIAWGTLLLATGIFWVSLLVMNSAPAGG